MALRLQHRLAFGLIAHRAAIASAFEFHDVLPVWLPSFRRRRADFAIPFVVRTKKKGAPTCAGAPLRSGHCRVCAQTEVVGATLRVSPWGIAPRENSHVVSALRVLGDVEPSALGLDVDAQPDDDVAHLVENRRAD